MYKLDNVNALVSSAPLWDMVRVQMVGKWLSLLKHRLLSLKCSVTSVKYNCYVLMSN